MVVKNIPRDIEYRLAKARAYKRNYHGQFLPDRFFGPQDRFTAQDTNTGIARQSKYKSNNQWE